MEIFVFESERFWLKLAPDHMVFTDVCSIGLSKRCWILITKRRSCEKVFNNLFQIKRADNALNCQLFGQKKSNMVMSTINLYSTEMLKAAYRNSMLHSAISDRNHPVYNSVNSFGFDTNAWFFCVYFAVWLVEAAVVLLKLRWNYVIMKLEAYRSVSVKCIWDIITWNRNKLYQS